MFKRVIWIGLLVMVTATIAYAGGISGWAWKCCSEVEGTIDVRGVRNPDKFPTIVVVSGVLNSIEVLCVNPANQNVAPGEAGAREVFGVNAIGNDEIVTNGKALVTIKFSLAGVEENVSCVNPNWTVLPDSAAATDMTLTMQWFACTNTGLPENPNDPCTNGNVLTIGANPIDQAKVQCILDPVVRDSEGKPLHDQLFTCAEIPV